LIVDLQKKLGLTYLFISHNLAVVRFLSNRVGVMYCGKLVELSDSKTLYTAPVHPYTQALLRPCQRLILTSRLRRSFSKGCDQPHQPAEGMPVLYKVPGSQRGVPGERAAVD